MSHVKISIKDRVPSIEVDGVEMNMMIMAEGFGIDIGSVNDGIPPTVRMVVAADVLEVDLPEAVVAAMRAGAEV